MPLLEDTDKPAILDDQLSVKNARVKWTVVGAGMLPFTSHLAFTPTIFCAVMVGVLKHRENANDRALADPPRNDYTTLTRPHRRRFYPDALGQGPIAETTAAAALSLLYGASYLEAFVRAEERAMGATAASEDSWATMQLERASGLLERSRYAQGKISKALLEQAEAWERSYAVDDMELGSDEPTGSEGELRVDLFSMLNKPDQEILRRTGLSLQVLDTEVTVPEPALHEPLSNQIHEATEASRQLGAKAATVSERLRLTSRRIAELPIKLPGARRLPQGNGWRFEIRSDPQQRWSWELISPSGERLGISHERFASRAEALRAAKQVKASVESASVME